MGTFFAPFVIIAAQAQSAGEVKHILNTVHEYRALHEQPIIEDFVALLSLPNVATNLVDIHQNADHIIKLLETRGFTTQRLTAGGAPYIYAELQTAEANETIMIYAHYDGQPVLEEKIEFFSPVRSISIFSFLGHEHP